MPEESAEVPQPPDSGSEGTTKESGVKRIHYIVHVDAETNQIIKVEELDESTNVTREMPLPLSLDDGEEAINESGLTAGSEMEFELTPTPASSFTQPAPAFPHGYFGYPMPMFWPMNPAAFMPAPVPFGQPVSFASLGAESPGAFETEFTLASSASSSEAAAAPCPKVTAAFATPKVTAAFATPKVTMPTAPSGDPTAAAPCPKVTMATPKVTAAFATPKVTTSMPPAASSEATRTAARPRSVVGPCLRVKPNFK